jgi:hypothetical protein
MTGNEALKVANAFARIHQRVSHKVLSLLFPSKCIHRGVQARIRERIPTAQYVHSKAHVLNLAIVHLSSDVSVKPMMAFTFQNSTKNG